MKRDVLEREILDWMRSPRWRSDDARFERLALALFRFQYEHCEPYARYARSLGRMPDRVARADEIPAVPTGAFKEFELRCFEREATLCTFRTSGTSLERRGELLLDTLELYEASLLASLRRCLLTDLTGRRPTLRILAPSAQEAPDGRLDLDSLARAIRGARERKEPLVLAGTSFAFVHLLDATTAESGSDPLDGDWALPAGSRIMETGGFKGRSREVPREVLRGELAACFGLPETSVVNQYGMTELGSQFYDSTLVDPDGPRRKLVPPWTRVRFVDPESGNDVDEGEVGMMLIQDLANSGSVAAILTADLGRAILDEAGERIGFDVLGRAEGAEARGCSLAADAMLAASGRTGSVTP
jgi:acyl-CoA synthetase (AMP-forming)/AMP-acid ligase II